MLLRADNSRRKATGSTTVVWNRYPGIATPGSLHWDRYIGIATLGAMPRGHRVQSAATVYLDVTSTVPRNS